MPACEGGRMYFGHHLDSGGGPLFAVGPAWEDNSDRDDARPSVAARSFAEADRVVEGLRDRLVGSRGVRAPNVPDSGRTFREKLLVVLVEELDKTPENCGCRKQIITVLMGHSLESANGDPTLDPLACAGYPLHRRNHFGRVTALSESCAEAEPSVTFRGRVGRPIGSDLT
jgi:hypothetical protein